jgi:hypothetical protein
VEREKMPKKNFTTQVIVAGGGITGVISAIAAARNGSEVVLVEKGSCLGGSATSGMLGEINGAFLNGKIIVPHIGKEIIDRLIEMGAGLFQGNVPMTSNPNIKVDRVRYNSEYLKLILDEMVEKENIKVLFCSDLKSIIKTPSGISIILTNLYEEIQINGTVLIDSTGNSEYIYMLGEHTNTTNKENKQAVTIIFRLGGIDVEEFEKVDVEEIQKIIKKGKKENILPGNILSMLRVPGTKDITINCTRCNNIDNESIEEVSTALINIRRQIRQIIPFIKKNVRGCKAAYLSSIASSLGIRDRRKIEGMYQIKSQDIINCTRFDDSVAVGVYPVDIHKNRNDEMSVEFIEIQGNGIYKIPYRSMLPKNLDNVLANGKCIDADDISFGAFRAIGPLMNIAVAAGTAAAMAVEGKVSTKDIDVKDLQKKLREMGIEDI